RSLPDRLEQRAVANHLVAGYERNAIGASCSPNKPIDGIFRIAFRKLSRQSGNLCCNWADIDASAGQKSLNCVLYCSVRTENPPREKKCQFPKGDVGNRQAITGPRPANSRSRATRQLFGLRHQPGKNMRIQQDHRRTFQSSSGTAGETMSPRISTSSLMHPKTSSATEGTGTSFTTGRPFLVTIKG